MKMRFAPRPLSALIILIAACCLYFLIQLLLARYHYQAGLDLFNKGDLPKAQAELEEALDHLPGSGHRTP
ncbi:MAG: hypothetical protein GY702_25485, partial [Desulfobulbaceae bacterium]|nr:hypothetical protein [Desulfobulbaceae bacterium]